MSFVFSCVTQREDIAASNAIQSFILHISSIFFFIRNTLTRKKKSQNQGFQFQSIPEMMVLHIESLHCHYCQEMVDQKLCSQVQTQCDLTAIERNLSSKKYCQQLLLFSLMKRNQDPTLFCICKGCIEV